MEKVGKCYGCKLTLYRNSEGQWVTKEGETHCKRGSYQDKRGHRIRQRAGALYLVVSNYRNEKKDE